MSPPSPRCDRWLPLLVATEDWKALVVCACRPWWPLTASGLPVPHPGHVPCTVLAHAHHSTDMIPQGAGRDTFAVPTNTGAPSTGRPVDTVCLCAVRVRGSADPLCIVY